MSGCAYYTEDRKVLTGGILLFLEVIEFWVAGMCPCAGPMNLCGLYNFATMNANCCQFASSVHIYFWAPCEAMCATSSNDVSISIAWLLKTFINAQLFLPAPLLGIADQDRFQSVQIMDSTPSRDTNDDRPRAPVILNDRTIRPLTVEETETASEHNKRATAGTQRCIDV